jgi:hypothetical protein
MDGNKKIHSIVSSFNAEGDFTVAGYSTEDAKIKIGIGTALHGSFLYQVAANGAATTITTAIPFEKRKDIVAKTIIFNGKKPILLGEGYYVNSKAAATAGDPFARDYTYSGNNIIIDGFDETGKPLYYKEVKKSNESVNDNGAWVSYFAAIVKGKLQLIFNDDKYKYDGKKNIVVLGSTKIVVRALVDPLNGAAEEPQAISNTGPVGGKGSDMYLRPDVFIRADDTHYIIRAQNNASYRMGWVAF